MGYIKLVSSQGRIIKSKRKVEFLLVKTPLITCLVDSNKKAWTLERNTNLQRMGMKARINKKNSRKITNLSEML